MVVDELMEAGEAAVAVVLVLLEEQQLLIYVIKVTVETVFQLQLQHHR